MKKKNAFGVLVIVFVLMFSGCAKRIPLTYDQTKVNSIIDIKTISGKTQKGLLKAKKPSFMVLQLNSKDERSLLKVNRDDIAGIQGKKNYIEDADRRVISEWDIQERKTNNNLMLYTFGGGGLSFGASFFIGTLLRRGIEDEEDIKKGENVMWGTTIVGTAVGTYLFSRAGAKRDRFSAIEKVREERSELARQQIEQERLKRKQVQEELEKLKAEQEKQKEEIRELQEKAKKKKDESEK